MSVLEEIDQALGTEIHNAIDKKITGDLVLKINLSQGGITSVYTSLTRKI